MKNYLIEDVKVGVSKGGMACGPVMGHVVTELELRDLETKEVSFFSMVEIDGCSNFFKTKESTYDAQIEEVDDEEFWDMLNENQCGDFDGYVDFFVDMKEHKVLDEENIQVWKLLTYLTRADWDEIDRMKAAIIGKQTDEIEIPVCDVEQEYLDDLEEEEEDTAEEPDEDQLWDEINDVYVGQQMSPDCFNLEEGETLEGDYSFDETEHDEDGNEYVYSGSYSLDENGVITSVGRISCKKLVGEDETGKKYADVSAAQAYEWFRDMLDGMM